MGCFGQSISEPALWRRRVSSTGWKCPAPPAAPMLLRRPVDHDACCIKLLTAASGRLCVCPVRWRHGIRKAGPWQGGRSDGGWWGLCSNDMRTNSSHRLLALRCTRQKRFKSFKTVTRLRAGRALSRRSLGRRSISRSRSQATLDLTLGSFRCRTLLTRLTVELKQATHPIASHRVSIRTLNWLPSGHGCTCALSQATITQNRVAHP
jgi:hypothetical protein